MSILNGGSAAGAFFGSMLTRAFGVTSTNFEALALLLLVCNVSSLAPLALLQLLPDSSTSDNIGTLSVEKDSLLGEKGEDARNRD